MMALALALPVPLRAFAEVDPNAASSQTSLTAPTTGAASHAKDYNFSFTAGLGARLMNDRLTDSNQAGLRLALEGDKYFTPELSSTLKIYSYIYTGAASNLLTDEGKPFTGVLLNEISLTYKPWKPLQFQAGILETAFSSLPTSMIDSLGFPGSSEKVILGGDKLNVSLMSRQLIPTASTLGSRYLPNDTTPFLLINTLELNSAVSSVLKLGASVAYFNFQNLSQGAAQDSQFGGNTILGLGNTAAKYAYDFEGLESALEAQIKLTHKWDLDFRGAGILNVQAPDGHNQGISGATKLSFTGSAYKLSGQVLYYYNQSDTLPATYTSINYGNNNRSGPGGSLRVDLLKQSLSFYGTWIRASVITQSPFQSDRNLVIFGAETTYAL